MILARLAIVHLVILVIIALVVVLAISITLTLVHVRKIVENLLVALNWCRWLALGQLTHRNIFLIVLCLLTGFHFLNFI